VSGEGSAERQAGRAKPLRAGRSWQVTRRRALSSALASRAPTSFCCCCSSARRAFCALAGLLSLHHGARSAAVASVFCLCPPPSS
jgi:hypothetical protein